MLCLAFDLGPITYMGIGGSIILYRNIGSVLLRSQRDYSGPFFVLTQFFHVQKRNEDQLDHVFAWREDFEGGRTLRAKNTPMFAVESGD